MPFLPDLLHIKALHGDSSTARRFVLYVIIPLTILMASGCSHGVDSAAVDNGFWPMNVGNTWTFTYSSSFRDWGVTGIGKPIEGTYSGTLIWEILSVKQTQDTLTAIFGQRFMGTATEQTYRVYPNDLVWTTHDLVDTTNVFQVSVDANRIINVTSDLMIPWQYYGLNQLFSFTQIKISPRAAGGDILSLSEGSYYSVQLKRNVGPKSLTVSRTGNSSRYALQADLVSSAQRN